MGRWSDLRDRLCPQHPRQNKGLFLHLFDQTQTAQNRKGATEFQTLTARLDRQHITVDRAALGMQPDDYRQQIPFGLFQRFFQRHDSYPQSVAAIAFHRACVNDLPQFAPSRWRVYRDDLGRKA